MCNPRRVRCHATRKIAEAWRAEIEQAFTAHSDVSSEARLVQSITDLLPPPARAAFEEAMRVSGDWIWADGEYRRDVPGGHITYRPDTGELEIVITLSVAIEAVGKATLVAAGEVTDEVKAEATSRYYEDLGGKEQARRRAQAAADAKVDEMAEQRRAALKFEAEESARHDLSMRTDEAAEEARRSAERQLTLQAEELQSDLDQRVMEQLDAVQTETLKAIFQLVASGYSMALQAYAAEHGENLEVNEEDGVISIQFELER